MRLELVRDWMTRELITAAPDTGLLDADKLMRDHNIRRLPVMENGRLVGIVTYGDVRSARPSAASSLSTWEMNYLLSKLTLGEVMTKSPVTIDPDDTIGQAAQIMLKRRISGLPVVDEHEKLVGIITESDIFRMVVHDWARRKEDDSNKPYAHYEES